MKKLLYLIVAGVMFTSCEKDFLDDYNQHQYEPENVDYEFKMAGRCAQDANGYYRLPLIPQEDKQTLHRFGAYVTNIDKWGLPTQVTWTCDKFWYTPDTLGFTYNGTSYADPVKDSVYCMIAPIGAMAGDTATVWGKAYFEEGDITIEDEFKIIFE